MTILNAELYKLKKSRPFWICILVCLFFGAFIPLTLQQMVLCGDPRFQGLSLSGAECLCYSFAFPVLSVVASIFISIFVSGEFHHGTMKNFVSKGYSRKKLFLCKFLTCALAVTVMFAVYLVTVLISGTVILGFDPHGVFSLSALIEMVPTLWLLLMAYTVVFVAISMTLRSNGAAIATNICLVTIFPTLLNAVDFLLNRFGIQASRFWIEGSISAVATWTPASGAVLTGICVAVVYLLLVSIVGTRLFCKQDIK